MNYIDISGNRVNTKLNILTGKIVQDVSFAEEVAVAALPRQSEDPFMINMKAGCRSNESCATCIFQNEKGRC